ncbi:PH domain-containing protein [Sphingomonas baiyangensis]|uniref:PH domain-containing protein n=1 Tax=Sphingomonas baiyangensis TaxID=2572576 RepID=A0A4U1L730_9SPHN|nr:PH domain-containing protein [Sphingomonas baiyangensis]
MAEHEIEPIRGLPGQLPPGERILWQGSPEWRTLARTAFHTRGIAAYFAILTGVALVTGAGAFGVVATGASGIVAVALLNLLAWATARGAVYTLTDRRVVLRIGVALPKCINLPLASIGSVDLAMRPGGNGDVALAVEGAQALGYAALWPHARAWHVARPQPMLRSIAQADRVGAMIARHCLAAQPGGSFSPAAAATTGDLPPKAIAA